MELFNDEYGNHLKLYGFNAKYEKSDKNSGTNNENIIPVGFVFECRYAIVLSQNGKTTGLIFPQNHYSKDLMKIFTQITLSSSLLQFRIDGLHCYPDSGFVPVPGSIFVNLNSFGSVQIVPLPFSARFSYLPDNRAISFDNGNDIVSFLGYF